MTGCCSQVADGTRGRQGQQAGHLSCGLDVLCCPACCLPVDGLPRLPGTLSRDR